MPRKKRTIVLVPPRGSRIRAIRVRVSLVVLLLIALGLGFYGYFIPFNSFTLDIVEQNQKKNLEDQNKQLLERSLSMRKLLKELRVSVGRLDTRKEDVERLVGEENADSPPEPPAVSATTLGLDELLGLVSRTESFYTRLSSHIDSESTFFGGLPVLLPVSGNPVLSASFGKVRDPFTGTVKWHQGIDLAAPRGTSVLATADGLVVRVRKDKKWGRTVRLKHGSSFVTVYAHLGTVSVRRGARVKRGQEIGTIGTSGLTTGPHLHYEVIKDREHVDPRYYVHPSLDSLLLPPDNLAGEDDERTVYGTDVPAS